MPAHCAHRKCERCRFAFVLNLCRSSFRANTFFEQHPRHQHRGRVPALRAGVTTPAPLLWLRVRGTGPNGARPSARARAVPAVLVTAMAANARPLVASWEPSATSRLRATGAAAARGTALAMVVPPRRSASVVRARRQRPARQARPAWALPHRSRRRHACESASERAQLQPTLHWTRRALQLPAARALTPRAPQVWEAPFSWPTA